MNSSRTRLKTPEEVELDRKRSDLTALQQQLVERERSFAAFRDEIRLFEQGYEEILGGRIARLEDLEGQLDSLLAGDCTVEEVDGADDTNDDTFSHFQHDADLLDDDAEQEPDAPGKSLKHLYREVAKAIHPDLASDDDERLRRQELMAMANQAYEMGDRSVLEDILGDRDLGPEPGAGI